jgi:hypothetical protein
MSAASVLEREGVARAAELMAETASAMDTEARRYAELATDVRQALRRGRVQRQAAWGRAAELERRELAFVRS